MTRQLADVNVLFALIWRRHEHHSAAHAWFEKSGRHAWASNALTQLGVLRLLTNPAVTQGTVNAASAVKALSEAASHPGHEFWPLNRQMAEAMKAVAGRIRGHRQWADAVLLSQAAERNGNLVTFDSGLKQLATGDWKGRVVLLRAGAPQL